MPDLNITLVQSNVHWEDSEANLSMFDQKINGIHEKTEVVILPEMFSTGFSMQPEKLAQPMDGPAVRWMTQISREKKIALTGSLIIEAEGKYYNRLLWVLPNGQQGIYDKRHLFGYAGENDRYTAGSKRLTAQVKGWKICLMVCYDLRFPVWLRQPADADSRYDLLVVVANWPESRNLAWQTLLRARAIENQCYVAGVNRTGNDGLGIHYCGNSCIIDPMGEILYTQHETEAIHTATLRKEKIAAVRNQFPFLEDADHFLII